jgi:hypothetical protein
VSYTHSIRMPGAPIVSVSWLTSHRTVSSRPPLAHRAKQQPLLPLGQARPTSEKVTASTASRSTSRTYSNRPPWQGRQARTLTTAVQSW